MRSAFLALAICLVSGCAHVPQDHVGEWIAFKDQDDEKEIFMEKYDIPKPNGVFYGLGFWELSPMIHEPPLAFSWKGSTLDIWIPDGARLKQSKLTVADCKGLNEALNSLLTSIGKTGEMMTDDKVWTNVPIVMDPTFYEVKYFPNDMLGSISLRNIDADRVPWIPAAKAVVEHAKACLK